MLLWEIIIIIVIGIAAVALTIFLIIRDIRGKGACSTGACSACGTYGLCNSDNQTESKKLPAQKN
ncbi:MAG: hypothetical protein FJW68_02025 [Actinobacteria bacterium]|nr:hypothetical protein [Actinomycetota bacterium]